MTERHDNIWLAAVFCIVMPASAWADLTLVEDGQARCTICVSPAVLSSKDINPGSLQGAAREAEIQRQRLRASVNDLALYLEKMSGAKIDIVAGEPQALSRRVPILVGDLAIKAFGPVGKSYPFRQAFRVVVSPSNPATPGQSGAVGLLGESDLATSYAIYEILDRLGCRWYMPSELGEVIPQRKTIRLAKMDLQAAPGTIYRGAPPCDAAYMRRNRLGGMPSACSFGSLEGYVSPEQRRQHPDWIASVAGRPHPLGLRWSKPEVADAIADGILTRLAKDPQPTMSMFLGGGSDFDDSAESRALDTGDVDPIFRAVSVSDRLLVLANRVAARVAAKSPETLLLLSAYTTAVRAPLRERASPNVVPVIVASVYDRAHPLTDDATPGNTDLRHAIEGWGRAARVTGCYAYAYNLAEPTAPNPMIGRWSTDLPIFLQNNCRFWIPESPANFETSLPAIYLAARLTFDPAQKPAAVIDRLMTDFYGHAAAAMTAYWRVIDDAWVKTPEYAGCSWGYSRRFTPEVLTKARQAMIAARAACQTPVEQARVEFAELLLSQFELFMKLQRDLAAGRWAGIEPDANRWRDQAAVLSKRFGPQFAYAASGRHFFDTFHGATYKDAARIAADCRILTSQPLRSWRYRADKQQQGQKESWFKPEFDDRTWQTTDPCVETWSTLGYHNYFGPMWYRATVDLSEHKPTPGKRVYLWIGNSDGRIRLFFNGQHVKFTAMTQRPDKTIQQEVKDAFVGNCCGPATFEITDTIRSDENQITLLCTRESLDELGVGGLLGPVVIYQEK